MSSFSGKAAKDAKRYFNELHVTVLTAFQVLFEDLEANVKQHIKTFESEVDDSESTLITSHYLQEVREDIEEVFEKLTSEDEKIHDIISEVSDISSAKSPDFSDVNDWKKKAVKETKELEEDVSSFTNTGNEIDVQAIMQQIEAVMDRAKSGVGTARFSTFESDSALLLLGAVKNYNEYKVDEKFTHEKALKEASIKNASSGTIMVGNKAYQDLKDGNITKDEYYEIIESLNKLESDIEEVDIDEEVSQTFLEYLWENKVEFGREASIDAITEYSKIHGSVKLGGMIQTFRGVRGENFVMVNPKSAKVAQPFLNPKTHKWAVNIGKWGGRVATPVGFGVGWYDDVQNQDKTHGQAVAHNIFTTGAGLGVGAVGFSLVSNPGGWAILGIAAGATLFSIGADYLYNNVEFVGRSVDWVGDRLSDIGQGIKSFFSGSNAAHTKYHSPGFNAP